MEHAFNELLADEPRQPKSKSTTKRSAGKSAKPRPGRLVKRTLAIAVLPLLASGAFFGYRAFADGNKPQQQFRTAAVDKGDITRTVTASGTLSPRVTVSVGAQVSGRIIALEVDYNSHVKKGQVIARIDRRLLDAEVARAKANLSSARARLTQALTAAKEASSQYRRDKKLLTKGLVSTADVETRRAAYQRANAEITAARATVSQAKAALELTKTNVGYATIISPIDGVVISRSVDVGQTVAASLQAPTLFTIAQDLKKMEVHTSVAESDVGQIKEGMAVNFTVDAYPKKTFAGVVKQVRYEAQTVQNVVTYDAVVSVDNGALELRPGMTANAEFIIAKRDGVLRIPTAATRFRPTSSSASAGKRPAVKKANANASAKATGAKAKTRARNRRRVYVLRNGQPAAVRITIGESDGKFIEVKKGALQAGDKLIVGTTGGGAAFKRANAKDGSNRKNRYSRRRIL
jgi:HlyD family secretion protein